MTKIINEIGNKYGYLTVVERAENNKNGKAMWKCQCKCGNTITVMGTLLRKGLTQSCGCYQKEQTSKAITKDLVGQTIGNFTVLESIQGTQHRHHAWRCRCNLCGNENAIITTTNLKKQYSCGCAIFSHGEKKIKELLENENINFIQEKRFSNLRFESNKMARFDFYLPDYNTLIEYDGSQHYHTGTGIFDSPEKIQQIQKRDQIKNKFAQDNNITLIRIPYTHFDKINIEDLLPETSHFIVTPDNKN